jgi:prolyl oligopeptidase
MPGFEPSLYETRQVRYKSKDGTEIPMFLIHKKGVQQNSKNPTFLYGYGGFNISLTPSFSVTRLLYIQHFGTKQTQQPHTSNAHQANITTRA